MAQCFLFLGLSIFHPAINMLLIKTGTSRTTQPTWTERMSSIIFWDEACVICAPQLQLLMRHSPWLYQYPDLCGHASYCSSHNFIGLYLFLMPVKYSCESARCQLRYSSNDISIINVLFSLIFSISVFLSPNCACPLCCYICIYIVRLSD